MLLPSSYFRISHCCLHYKECVQVTRSCYISFTWGLLSTETGLKLGTVVIHVISFCRAGCQGCDRISVILSDYCASAGSLCPLHVSINSRISLTDLLCVPCRQIGQLVPRWQLYRYGGNWCGPQGHAADSSWGLLEVPSLHWSSHVPEI